MLKSSHSKEISLKDSMKITLMNFNWLRNMSMVAIDTCFTIQIISYRHVRIDVDDVLLSMCVCVCVFSPLPFFFLFIYVSHLTLYSISFLCVCLSVPSLSLLLFSQCPVYELTERSALEWLNTHLTFFDWLLNELLFIIFCAKEIFLLSNKYSYSELLFKFLL